MRDGQENGVCNTKPPKPQVPKGVATIAIR
jgi:hypothetical protein